MNDRPARGEAEHSFRRDDYARLYRRDHPLAIWFCLGIAFIGLLTLIFPDAVEQSATSLALGETLRKLFYVCYALGGTLGALGLLSVRHRLEAAGMAMLASTMTVQFVAIVYVRPAAWAPSLFVLALAIGCGTRAWLLSTSR